MILVSSNPTIEEMTTIVVQEQRRPGRQPGSPGVSLLDKMYFLLDPRSHSSVYTEQGGSWLNGKLYIAYTGWLDDEFIIATTE